MEDYLPDSYKQVRNRYAKVHARYQQLAESYDEAGPIPEKDRQLVKLRKEAAASRISRPRSRTVSCRLMSSSRDTYRPSSALVTDGSFT